jgi:hypothetical protein
MPSSNVFWPTPLTRWPTLFPGQFGVPGTDSDRGLRQDSNGKIIWVDPNHVDANDQRDGTNPDSPMRTVAAALTKCRPYAGDVIAVMHNACWTYANLAVGRAIPVYESVIVTTPGIRIVGVAPSSSLGVPWIPPASNATCITVRAMDVLIEGFCFWQTMLTGTTGILAQWESITLKYFGENLTIRNCFFYDLAYGIQLDYTWNCYVENNSFFGMTTAAIHNPTVYGEPSYLTIRNNVFADDALAVNLPACDHEVIQGNIFNEAAGGTNNMINLTGGVSNFVCDNYFACTIGQYDTTCSSAGSGAWVNNHATNGDITAPPT